MCSNSKLAASAALVIFISFSISLEIDFAGYLQAASVARGDGYVDPQICAKCHRQIAEDYARTGMGRSFFRPATVNTLEAYTDGESSRQAYFHDLSETYFSMVRRD